MCDKQNTCAGQTRIPQSEVTRWAAIPRNSPRTHAGAYGKLLRQHPTQQRVHATPKHGGYPRNSTRAGHEENLPTKSIRLGTGILDIQAPKRPFRKGAQRNHFQMRGSEARTARNTHIAHAKLRVLISFGHQSGFDCLPAINLLPGEKPTRLHQILGLGA